MNAAAADQSSAILCTTVAECMASVTKKVEIARHAYDFMLKVGWQVCADSVVFQVQWEAAG